jgi:2-oxo-4-hydroxy-4-carboxy-5-ureidoimidazoline decarboxylase
MLDLDTINQMDRNEFVGNLGRVFENSPWVANRAWNRRPFADVPELHTAMFEAVQGLDPLSLQEFLCAHPDLAGSEAKQGIMTAESTEEQGTAGLDRLSRAELAEIDDLNRRYRARHGFPFIVCARHYTKAGIFAEFHHRLERDSETERTEALRQIGNISRYRLDALVQSDRETIFAPAA